MNYILAIIIATIASFLLGFLWYGPLFGKRWMKLCGLKKSDVKKNDMTRSYMVMIVCVIITAVILQMFIVWTNRIGAGGGAQIGFFAGLGFVMTTMAMNYMFSGKSRSLYLIDAGFPLVNLTMMGAIIGALL